MFIKFVTTKSIRITYVVELTREITFIMITDGRMYNGFSHNPVDYTYIEYIIILQYVYNILIQHAILIIES